MTIDYDVVIIGGSPVARYAALIATQIHAKVALVEPDISYGFLNHHVMSNVGKLAQQLSETMGIGVHLSQDEMPGKPPIAVDWQEVMQYAQAVAANVEEQNSVAILAAQGVDVIFGNGQFQSSPHLAFAVNNRLLCARNYLLASGSRPAVPEIDGLQTTGYLTLANLWQSLATAPKIPQNWVILGGVPQSVAVAQILARLGCHVTLIMQHPYILPLIDSAIAQLLQAQLEIDGVRILTDTPVTQVMRIDGKKWIQAGDKAIETDEIIVATAQQPNIESLNLPAVGVKWHGRRLVVNNKLQTTNQRIYACGDVIGGYDFINLAHYEARIALKNALFFPRLTVNYRCLPTAIFTHPTLAQVGLTETQAKRLFNHHDVLVSQSYFKTITASQIQNATTGICKLITLSNGEILGAEILGEKAEELINIVALAIAQKIQVKHLANLSPVYPSFAEILEQVAREWSQQKLNKNIAWQEFLEGFFHLRREWNF
jgi:pyruvate/2-oxoglutarate dehydrogenase complex dihydrolipoamide dehydrogenase (E3) component